MSGRRSPAEKATRMAAQVGGVALAWCALYELNGRLFEALQLNGHISWIFLPAALRLVAVLLFDGRGAAGLFIGALATQPGALTHDPGTALSIAAISALAPWLAVRLCLKLMRLPRDLSGLGLRQVAIMAAASAATSVVLHHAYLTRQSGWELGLQGVAPMFLGDLAGMLILGWLASRMLRFGR
jgi:hypothetical protein